MGSQGPILSRRQVLGGGLIGTTGLVLAGTAPGASQSAAVETASPPEGLSVDGLSAPIGLSPDDVYFAWRLGDRRRGAVQKAYRIRVWRSDPAGSAERSDTVWDSGSVHSSEQAFIPYAGRPLEPDATYGWTVRTWAALGGPSSDAPAAAFETGLTDRDWKARWIQRVTDVQAEPDQYTYA